MALQVKLFILGSLVLAICCWYVTTKTNGTSEVSLKRGKTQSNLGQTSLNGVCRVPPCIWVVVGQNHVKLM